MMGQSIRGIRLESSFFPQERHCIGLLARDIDTDKLLGKARHLPTCMHHPVLLHINGIWTKDRNSESL